MKRSMIVGVVLALAVASFAAPATAKKKKAKPVATTLFLHGNAPVGDGVEVASNVVDGTVMTMDTTEPTQPVPSSMSYSAPVGNPECTGNPFFPSWEGKLTGKVVGDVKLIAHLGSAPGTAIARLWTDVPFASCTSETAGVDAFVEPVAEVEVEVPAGHSELEIVFEDINVKVAANMIVELHQTSLANQGRIFYDSPDFASHLEFGCVPASGKTCATS
ncbi:MAG: hypothetical protein ACRDLB_03130 [Actinomycetota bacterium]